MFFMERSFPYYRRADRRQAAAGFGIRFADVYLDHIAAHGNDMVRRKETPAWATSRPCERTRPRNTSTPVIGDDLRDRPKIGVRPAHGHAGLDEHIAALFHRAGLSVICFRTSAIGLCSARLAPPDDAQSEHRQCRQDVRPPGGFRHCRAGAESGGVGLWGRAPPPPPPLLLNSRAAGRRNKGEKPPPPPPENNDAGTAPKNDGNRRQERRRHRLIRDQNVHVFRRCHQRLNGCRPPWSSASS